MCYTVTLSHALDQSVNGLEVSHRPLASSAVFHEIGELLPDHLAWRLSAAVIQPVVAVIGLLPVDERRSSVPGSAQRRWAQSLPSQSVL